MKNDDRTFFKIGVLGAFLASLCCIGPLILIALGVGTASSVLSIGYNKPYFLVGALVVFVAAAVFYFRKQHKAACDCGDDPRKSSRNLLVQIALALCAMVVLYLLLTFVLVPFLAPLVYKYLY